MCFTCFKNVKEKNCILICQKGAVLAYMCDNMPANGVIALVLKVQKGFSV